MNVNDLTTEEFLKTLNLPANTPPHEVNRLRHVIAKTGLDPLQKQIHVMPLKGSLQVVMGIDGLRTLAHRIAEKRGETLSITSPEWCSNDGAWRDSFQGTPLACKVTVTRNGSQYTSVVHFKEYSSTGGVWATKPLTMIAKVAESQALRKAFPMEASGAYIPEEIEAENDTKQSFLDQQKIAEEQTLIQEQIDASTRVIHLQAIWNDLNERNRRHFNHAIAEKKAEIEKQDTTVQETIETQELP